MLHVHDIFVEQINASKCELSVCVCLWHSLLYHRFIISFSLNLINIGVLNWCASYKNTACTKVKILLMLIDLKLHVALIRKPLLTYT